MGLFQKLFNIMDIVKNGNIGTFYSSVIALAHIQCIGPRVITLVPKTPKPISSC